MAITYTHSFEIDHNGNQVTGQIGRRENGETFYQIGSQVPPKLAETINSLMESIYDTDGTVTKIEVNKI